MSKTIKGAREILGYLKGDKKKAKAYYVRTKEINVKAVREKLGMSQQDFADTFAFSVSTIRKWEIGERVPEGPAKAYLYVIDKSPKTVMNALAD
jgi:putative transcriptional regulator